MSDSLQPQSRQKSPDSITKIRPRETDRSSNSGCGFGSLIGMLGMVLAIATGLGRGAARQGGDIARSFARGVDHVPGARGGVDRLPGTASGSPYVMAPDSVASDTSGRSKDLLDELVAPGARSGEIQSLRQTPHASQQEGIEIKGIDASGLVRDAKDLSLPPATSEEDIRQLTEKEGISILIITKYCREEHRGVPYEDLDEVKDFSDTDTIASVGKYVLYTNNEKGTLLDAKKGEHNRCRVRFGGDGRPFLSIDIKQVHGEGYDATEFKGHYELQLVNGTEADFHAGKPVTLCYSAEGLRRFEQDSIRLVESLCGRQLRGGKEAAGSLLKDLAPRVKVTGSYALLPNSRIVATPSSVIMEDQGRTVMRVHLTFPPR